MNNMISVGAGVGLGVGVGRVVGCVGGVECWVRLKECLGIAMKYMCISDQPPWMR
jgi:hypothetical protein